MVWSQWLFRLIQPVSGRMTHRHRQRITMTRCRPWGCFSNRQSVTRNPRRRTMQRSATKAEKYIDRASALTHTPGSDPELHASQPKFPSIAEAFVEGRIPGENVDRIIALDNDLTKYATEVGESRDFKDAV